MSTSVLLTAARAAHLYSCVTGAHHTSTSRMHLGQVVESQDVTCLGGQIEEL